MRNRIFAVLALALLACALPAHADELLDSIPSLDAILHGTQPVVPADDAFRAMSVCFAIERATKRPGAVEVKVGRDPGLAEPALAGQFPVHGDICQPALELLRAHVAKFPPERAETISTVPARTLRRLAGEFGDAAQILETGRPPETAHDLILHPTLELAPPHQTVEPTKSGWNS